MSVKRTFFRHRLLLGGALLAVPLLVGAAPPGPADGPADGCGPDFHGGPPHPPGPAMGPRFGPGFGPFSGEPEDNRPPRFLMGLKLSEDQQDKVFTLMHAAAPALRDQSKALRKAREALHDLTRSTQYSNDAAVALAQTQGKAEGQLALLHTRLEHDVFAVLTSEQKTQLADRAHDGEPHHGEDSAPH